MSARGKLPYAAFIVAAPVSAVLVYVATRPFLPSEIADFNNMPPFITGDPSAPASILLSGDSLSVVATVVALAALWKTPAGVARYGRIAVLYAWFASLNASVSMVQSIGANDFDASQARWWLWWLLAPTAIPLVVINRALAPRPHVDQSGLPPPDSALSLRPDERVVWTSWSNSNVSVIVGCCVAAAALAIGLIWSPAALVGLLFGGLFATSARVRTTADRGGVTVHGFPRYTIPLEEIRTVSATEAPRYLGNAMRIGRPARRDSILHRRRPALVVEYGDNATATISVDNAAEGADVINGLLARLRTSARSS